MIFPASIFLAAAIHTVTNGAFFALPGWMPTSVDADHTPGGNAYARMRRMDPETLAGVNAVFEGWYERVYFGSQGQTNDLQQANEWDAAVWGDLDTRGFDFTIGSRFDPLFRWSPPNDFADTNAERVVEARRLVEWRNARALAKTMIEGSDDFAFFVDRPGWLSNTWWATSASMDGLAGGFLPAFGWRADAVGGMRGGDCLPTLAQRGDCDVFGDEGDAETPAHFLMDRVIPSGTPVRAAFGALAADAPHSTTGLDAVVVREFQGVVSGGVTNATRRLFRDAAGEMAGLEALMDRTLHSPDALVTNLMTNATHWVTLAITGAVQVSWSFYGDVIAPAVTNVEWSGAATNRAESGSAFAGPGEDLVATRFSGTYTEVSKAALAALDAEAWADGSTVFALLAAAIGPPPDGAHVLYVQSVILQANNGFEWLWNGSYTGSEHVPATPFSVPFFADVTNATTISTAVVRRYSCARTVGGVRDDCATQPGWEGWPLAEESRAGALEGVMSVSGEAWSATARMAWPETPAAESEWAEHYRTRVGGVYANRRALVDFFDVVRRDLLDEESALLGVNVELPEIVIPVSADMAAGAVTGAVWRAVISNNDPYFPAGFYLGCEIADGSLIRAWMKVDASAPYEMELPQLVETAQIAFTNAGPDPSPSVEERKPFAADGRWRVVTRTDWNWNASTRE